MFISVDSLDQFNLRLLLLLYRRDNWFQLNGLYVGGRGNGRDWDQLQGVGLQVQRIQLSSSCCHLGMADVGEGSVLGLLVNIVHRLRPVLLLVVNETAAIRSSPGALVTLVRVFSGVASPVVDQVVRTFELFTTKVTCVAKFCFVNQLVFL